MRHKAYIEQPDSDGRPDAVRETQFIPPPRRCSTTTQKPHPSTKHNHPASPFFSLGAGRHVVAQPPHRTNQLNPPLPFTYPPLPQELADIWWRNHLKRELSVVVGLFSGQYRTVTTCPACQ